MKQETHHSSQHTYQNNAIKSVVNLLKVLNDVLNNVTTIQMNEPSSDRPVSAAPDYPYIILIIAKYNAFYAQKVHVPCSAIIRQFINDVKISIFFLEINKIGK